ncbi:MAG: M15 family metallopeptidase [Alphaproteobacteria bacterium]|nr:MAG: M15 family metallopeptidase [Alphaproteobacteria bacterium]
MSPQRSVVIAVFCAMLGFIGGVVAAIITTPPETAIADHGLEVPAVSLSNAGLVYAGLPHSRQVLPRAPIVLPSMPAPAQNDVAVSAPPAEVPKKESAGPAWSGPAQVLPAAAPPVPIAASSPPDAVQIEVEAAAPRVEMAALPDVREVVPPVRIVSLFRSDPLEEDLKPVTRALETPNECLVAEICIDDYLWSFYERTPKVDTNKVTARIKVTVKKKGKTRTVTKTVSKYVIADFTWKDPIAALRAGMSVKDYVIGGMDRGFKLKLYHALRAMEDAGLMPGITSAFRDDYRQSIASGKTAASDSSYHGGSRRGGYGHGLAADLVSVKGETRLQRFASSVELWKWIDAHEKELGVGRPYLDRDPPHVGPIDGKEYADKRGGARLLKLATVRRAR